MPYEIASAAVRTLAIHCAALGNAKSTLQSCQDLDPGLAQPGSVKAQDALAKLQDATRYIVMNRRTCQMATQEFISKHIKEENGKPVLKKEGTKIQPWIMSLKFHQVGIETELELRLTNEAPFRKLRCLDLTTGQRSAKIVALMDQYPDMQDEFFESDAESEATMIGEDQGLEGRGAWLAGLFSYFCLTYQLFRSRCHVRGPNVREPHAI